MVFSSLIFLYAFLPLNLLAYALAKDMKTKNWILLIFSLVFYAWGEPVYVLLLVGDALVNWYIARRIERCVGQRARKPWLVLACAVSLGVLGVFKYGTFTLQNLHVLFGIPKSVVQIALPIGISFYTFQILTYTVDVYRGEVPAQRSFMHVLLYASLFHQCIAGPIVRYKDVSEEITERHVSLSDRSYGVRRFVIGLAKKALLANVCGEAADTILLKSAVAADASQLSTNTAALASRPALLLWVGCFMYMMQIYLDFSAYSDMAIGMGRMVGFHYKENFEYPYIAASVTQFWRRWHISLSTFFRDYVYIPMGGNRRGMARTLLNMFVVWLLTGFWHGASWNFVLWGLYYFVFLAAEKLFLGKALEDAPKALGHLYTLLVVFFGWILFRFERMGLAVTVVRGLFCANGNAFSSFEALNTAKGYLLFSVIVAVCCTPILHRIDDAMLHRSLRSAGANTAFIAWRILAMAALMTLSTAALVGNSYNPFLYLQF